MPDKGLIGERFHLNKNRCVLGVLCDAKNIQTEGPDVYFVDVCETIVQLYKGLFVRDIKELVHYNDCCLASDDEERGMSWLERKQLRYVKVLDYVNIKIERIRDE